MTEGLEKGPSLYPRLVVPNEKGPAVTHCEAFKFGWWRGGGSKSDAAASTKKP
jgi:hypothetical protein